MVPTARCKCQNLKSNVKPPPSKVKKVPKQKTATEIAQSLGMQVLVKKLKLFDKQLPLRLVQSKEVSIPKLKITPKESILKTEEILEDHIQYGNTVDSLREYFAFIFKYEWPENILDDNVVFIDGISPRFNLLPFNAIGKKQYDNLMWFVRFYASLFCEETQVEILRFWQPCKETIVVRWSVKLCPRVLYSMSGTTIQIDGVSEFKISSKGKIYQHNVDMSDRHNFKFDLHFQTFIQRKRLGLSAVGTT